VPAAAVVYTGPRKLVFLDLKDGRFKPQEVHVGLEANGMYEILEGLHAGDVVATSGVFLIAAEARITTAAKYWDDKGDADAEPSPSSDGMQPAVNDGMAPTPSMSTPPPASPAPMHSMKAPPSAPMHAPTPSAATATSPSSAPAAVYSCPMHPEVRSSTPGKCPKCGMDLERFPAGAPK
jgi:hypothetical protein